MTEAECNVVDFRKALRRAIDRRYEARQRLVEWVIDQAKCDVGHLFGASAVYIANVSLAIANQVCPIGDSRRFERPITSAEVAERLEGDEALLGFIAAVAGDALQLEHVNDPAFSTRGWHDECLVETRKIVAAYFRRTYRGRTTKDWPVP